jgi:small ligand-binding sensory domain FIST
MAHDDSGHLTSSADHTASFMARAAVVATGDWMLAVDLVEADLLDDAPVASPPDLLIVFINDAWQADYGTILTELRERTGAATIIGGSASGILADGHEFEDAAGIAAMALWLPGVTATPVRLHQESLALLEDAETWRDTTAVDPASVRGIVLLADPYRMDANALLCGLRQRYPGVPVAGGMMSASEHRRQTWVFIDTHVYDEGGVALLLQGAVTLRAVVAHGAEPVGEAWTITKVDRNVILEISGRPALDVLLDTAKEVAGGGGGDDFPYGEWLIGFPVNEYQDRFARGDFIIRGILGGDPETHGIVVGGKPRSGQTVQFQRRDPALAGEDLRDRLVEQGEALHGQPAAGLLFTCNGRGEAMFRMPHHDAASVATMLPGVPVAGMFCNGEVGPSGPAARPTFHGFTATLALLVPDDASS